MGGHVRSFSGRSPFLPDGAPVVAAVCRNHPGSLSAGACERCGTFTCTECRSQREGFLCLECARLNPTEPRKLGGLLVLPMLALFASPLRWLGTTLLVLADLRKAGWEAASSTPGWLEINGFNIFSSGALAGFALFILPRFFARRADVPGRMIALYGFTFLAAIVSVLISAGFAEQGEPVFAKQLSGSIGSLAWTFAWIRYFQVSDRVKETFVR